MPLWHGRAADRWFAVLHEDDGDRDRLLVAHTAAELGQHLEAARARAVRPEQAPTGVPGTAGVQWSPPPVPPRPERPEQSERPGPPKRPVRGRHEVDRRRGWLARLLDRLTYTGDDFKW